MLVTACLQVHPPSELWHVKLFPTYQSSNPSVSIKSGVGVYNKNCPINFLLDAHGIFTKTFGTKHEAK
jgi:hypothetical protein